MARLVAFTSISGIWPGIKGEALLQAKPYLREVILQRETIPDPLAYPFNIPALRALKRVEFHPDVTFIAGENGTGKSTLIEAIAMKLGFSQEGGTKNMQVQTAHTVSGLSEHLKLVRSFARPSDGYFFRAESLYNVATYMDQDERDKYHLRAYDNLSMHKRSHGELFFTTLTKKFSWRRTLHSGRTRGGPFAQPAVGSANGDSRTGKGQLTVHYRHPLPHSPGLPQSEDTPPRR